LAGWVSSAVYLVWGAFMVSIFVGSGAGFQRGSGNILGGAGILGSGVQGRSGESVSVNAATGNLLISQQDEFLVGRGPDAAIQRIYNSLAEVGDGDNGDQWQFSTTRRAFGLTGTLNAVGSTIRRQAGDGSVVTYGWDAGQSAYVATDGDGAHDWLVKSGATWVWTDGSSRVTETYEASAGDASVFRIKALADTDGNALDYLYIAGTDKLEYVTTANHGRVDGAGHVEMSYVQYVWAGNNIGQIVTGYMDYGDNSTDADNVARSLVRTHYAYDAQNRLTQVFVDLSPEDASMADGKYYSTTYTYDGSSKRVASITQTDGSSLAIAYDASGRVTTLTQIVAAGDTRVTSLAYGLNYTNVTGPDGLVTRLDYAGENISLPSISDWDSSDTYVTKAAAGSIGGSVATKLTAGSAGWAGIYTNYTGTLAVAPGDTIQFSVSLMAVAGSATEQDIGLYGQVSQWGSGGATARILSGPGTIVQSGTGFVRIAGLSTTEPTRVELTRTYDVSELANGVIYVDSPGGCRAGQQLIAADAVLTRNASPNGSFRQLKKITAPPAYAGAPTQTLQFAYDAAGNLTSVTDTAGKVTAYSHDANGNVLTSTDPNGNVVTRTYGSKNELLTETRTGSDASGAAVAHTTGYVYDSENHLRYAISAEGRVTEYIYTAAGEIGWQIEYSEHAFPIGATAPTEAEVIAWRNTITDKQGDKIVTYVYDARGNRTQEIDYGYAAPAGHGVTSEGYAHHYFTYDQSGKLLSRVTATLATESFVYDGLGRMVASTDMAGATTTIIFNDAALTTTITTASGYTTVSNYNKAGDLVGTTNGGFHVNSGTTAYLYDKNGRLRVAIDAVGNKSFYLYDKAGHKIADINHHGQIIEYRYDAAGRVAATAQYTNALLPAQLAALGDPNNLLEAVDIRPAAHDYDIWSWSIYDDSGRLIQSIDGSGGVTAFSYDASGRLVKTVDHYNKLTSGQLAALKTVAPTTPTLPTADTRDAVSRSFYDRDGRLLGALDGEGYLSEIVYDKAGQKVEEVAYATKASSTLWGMGTLNELRSTAAPDSTANRRTHYVYDGQGLLRFTVDNAGYVTEYVYKGGVEWDAIGLVRSTVRHAAAIFASDFTYDNVKALVAANAGHALNRMSWLVYDWAGRMNFSIDADGAVAEFTYDAAGNIIKTVAFEARRPTSALPGWNDMASWCAARMGDSANHITRNWYTAHGELRFTVDAEGYITRFDYDAEGRVSSEYRWGTAFSVGGSTTADTLYGITYADDSYVGTWYSRDGLGRVTSERLVDRNGYGPLTVYDYYANGLLASIWQAYGSDDQSLSTRIYDGAGRLIAEYSAWGEPEQSVVQYGYDGLGNLLSVTDARGKVTSYTYDERGLVLTKTDAAGGVTSYEYNAFGEVVKMTDPKGGVTYTYYDELGRVAKVRDAEDYVTETTYTAFGEIATVTRRYEKTASAASTTTLPTVTAHAQDATTSFEYDKRGLVTKTTDAEGFFESCGYDALGNRTSVTAKSKDSYKVAGGATTYAYDRRGLLVSETLPVASYLNDGSVQSSSVTNTYAYDARGNRTQMVEAAGLIEARTTSYEYDKANRLTKTTGQAFLGMTPIEYLTYDARGNLTSRTDPAGARTVYFYDDLDRVVVTINAVGTYSANIYDANGNITSTTIYGAAVAVPSDGGSEEERPAAPGGSSRVTNFTYDNLNRLLTSSVAGVNSYITSGASNALLATTLHTAFEYDANGNVIKAIDANGNASFNYYDKLGRKTATLDAAGYLTTWTYYAEGNVHVERRHATRFTGTPTTALLPNVPTNASDRVSQYGYDRNGNRTIELRFDVLVHDGAGGTTTLPYAAVYHTFNGLGQVVSKWEATSDRIDYYYDFGGRLTLESRAAYVDNNGNSVSPMVDYYYNGLGNLSRTRQRGAGDAAARITYYNYDGDKLLTAYDSAGFMRAHWYDIAGRETYNYYTRWGSNGLAAAEYDGLLTSYDAAGRATQQWQANYVSGTGWVDSGPRTVTTYNAYGEATSVAVGGVTQQQNQYDAGGRLVASNAGDGVWKHFGYDAGGNQTIAITSAGASLAGLSFDQALALVGQENVNATYTQYDARGQAIGVTEEQRQLSGSNVQTLTSSRSYNAFGDVVSETNAAGAVTTYAYNNIGRMIRSEGPSAQITLENGGVQSVRAAQDFYYDLSGRLVATRDANGSYDGSGTKIANTGNLTRLTLLAGTGYGGSEALVTQQIAADGGVKQTKYDVHGDARTLIDEIGRTTTQLFDGMGRVTQVTHAGGLIDDYRYDGLGQRIKHWNNLLGSGEVETTDYDTQGRVITTRAFGGDITTTSYTWDASIAASGMGVTTGGWTEVTTMANGRTLTEKSDLFGRVTWKSDLGGHVTTYAYDLAGRQTSSTMGGVTASFTYYNTGRQATNSGPAGAATYGYDAAGNRIAESLVNGVTIKSASATYDGQGRLKTWAEAGTAKSPAASTSNEYDANGNIRRTQMNYRMIDADGVAASSATTSDQWFAFDSMNRLVTDKGSLSGGAIVRGTGTSIAYNVAGERTYSQYGGALVSRSGVWRRTAWGVHTYWTERDYDDGATWTQVTISAVGDRRENYGYDGAGRLATITQQDATVTFADGTSAVYAGALGGARTRSVFGYDAMGRLTSQSDYNALGTSTVFSRNLYYNAKGQLLNDDASTLKSDGYTYRNITRTDYGAGSGYALGSIVATLVDGYRNGNDGDFTDTATTYAFDWYDGAVQSGIWHDKSYGNDAVAGAGMAQGSTLSGFDNDTSTSFVLNGFGQLASATITDGQPRSVTFTNDEAGQVIRRDETRPSNAPTQQTGSPHEIWYRFAGREMGYTGNNSSEAANNYNSIADRQASSPSAIGTFRGGSTNAISYADFVNSYDAVTTTDQGSASGSYTVRGGDTLASIAAGLWGDASLWYQLAGANGMSANSALIEGQTLTLPAGVTKSAYNANTFKPYDPAEAIGDLSPTTPKPAKKPKCGVFGQILVAAIAIGLSVWLGPQFIQLAQGFMGAFAGAVAGGAAAGAVSSAVSQGFGVATGIQDKFSWKAVGMAAIAGGIGGAVAPSGGFGENGLFGSGTLAAAGRGVVSSALTQGVGVATGLQSKFDFAGVAAAGVGAGVGDFVGGRIGDKLGNFGRDLAANTAGGIANAATRSAINGNSFGDNLRAAIPDIIGQAIGNMMVDGIVGRGGASRNGGNDRAKRGDAANVNSAVGVGDGTAVQSVARAGSSQVGGIAGSDGEAEIVVIADPHMHNLYRGMSDYQWGWYFNRMGQRNDHGVAHMALGLAAPAVTTSFNALSRYESPLIQSLKTARPYGLYSDGLAPTQQYMLGDGSVFTGTPSALARLNQQRSAQAGLAYIDRLSGSPIAGIALGISSSLGASPATQDLIYGLGNSADGLVMAYGGVRGAAIPGNNSQTNLSVEMNLRLRYMSEWTAEQRAAADLKVGVLDISNAAVSQGVRGGKSGRSMFARENGPIVRSNDIDHLIDLQLGGSHTLPNLWPLDASVNRSLGAQIQNQIQGLPPGTRINRVTIGN